MVLRSSEVTHEHVCRVTYYMNDKMRIATNTEGQILTYFLSFQVDVKRSPVPPSIYLRVPFLLDGSL